MKKILFLLVAILLLSGCSNTQNDTSINNSSHSTETPMVEESQDEAAAAADTLYPITQDFQWLDGGTLLAVPEGNIIRYVDLNNEMVKAVELPADKLLGEYRYQFANNRILVMGEYGFGGQEGAGYLSACSVGGEWVLSNGSIWDSEGLLLQEFPSLELLSDDPWSAQFADGRGVVEWKDTAVLENARWVSDDLLALDGRSRLFLYRLSTDTLTLVDDMSGWMEEYGKMQAYLGVASIMPAQDGVGCYYFAHKDTEKSNTAGTVWYADESGNRELFGGQEFNHVQYDSGLLVMVDWTDDDGITQETQVWCALENDLTLQKLDTLPGGYSLPQITDGNISMTQVGEPYQFIVIQPLENGAFSYTPEIEGCTQYEILGVRQDNGGQQIFYSTFIDGDTGLYLYDTQTGTNTMLDGSQSPLQGSLNDQMTHYVEFYPDRYDTAGVRIRAIS